MDALTTAAASGLRARIESIELLANNLANATTAGFKADREFYSTYLSPESLDGPQATLPTVSPVVEQNWIDFAQGSFLDTGAQLDVALSGPGFFVLDSPQGPLYTRNGNFQLSKDGILRDREGLPVSSRDGKPIRLSPNLPVEISPEGVIRQSGAVVAQLQLVDFERRQELTKAGATYFRYSNPANPPRPAAVRLEQGRLENTNYQPAEAAVRLVSVMRQFEMLNRALALGGEMNKRSIEEVAKARE